MLEQGFQVIGLSRSIEPISSLLPYSWTDKGNVNFYQLDINCDLERIERLLDIEKPTHIFNFAAQSMVGQSWEKPEDWFRTNTVSTIKLHNILRHKDYLERYIHISTPEVYGSCEGFVDETHSYNPSTPYAVSRAAADMSLKTFFDVHQFPVVTTRAANVYGEGQQLYRIIPKTILSILSDKKLPLHGGGHSERSFIHIDDVSSATALIGENGTLGDVYHISTLEKVSIRYLVELICEEMNTCLTDVCEVSDDRPGKDAAYLLDTTKLRSQLGWSDQISLGEGIHRTIAWVRNNLDELILQPDYYIHKA